MKFFPLLILALFFVACGDATETVDSDVDVVTTAVEDPMAAQQTEAAGFLQTTVQAVQSAGGDITALSPEAAANNINGWITKLSQFDGTDAIVDDLAELKKEFLLGGDLDGEKISGILSSMAGNTRDVSDKAPGLDALANALQAGADKLSGK
ncbi:hypothetical protein [Neolewinella antarctica]|uniref:Lipoprotein n=1 Tax=Neolewinella antarctica TaxID=442734 RepID=A0ABX0XDM1_9BACT|nr:hypothetical protein [Neolewinella antarctica]NJC27401.1 hypothetical protein [Neolewinella antarctica]